jgi:hypothetical protein
LHYYLYSNQEYIELRWQDSEIYPRTPDDPNYKEGLLHTDDEVEILIGMIKQCMLTTPGEVLGDPYFGIDLEGLLFDFNVDQATLERAIRMHLLTYVPLASSTFNVDFTVGFFKGETRDACVIDFAIKGNPILGIKII